MSEKIIIKWYDLLYPISLISIVLKLGFGHDLLIIILFLLLKETATLEQVQFLLVNDK